MLNAFSVRWLESDETKIRYTEEFESASWILKADILQDAMYELEKKYDQILDGEANTWHKHIQGKLNATK